MRTTSWIVIAFVMTLGCSAESPQGGLSKDEARALAAAGKADLPDFCAEQGWYGDGVCDSFCAQPDPDCTPCEAAGGACVALYPGNCADGTIGDANVYSCGGGLGVMCCLPALPPEPTPCEAAGGACVADAPGACQGGTIGDATEYSCGGGIGVMCCLPDPECTPPDPGQCPIGMCYCGTQVGVDENCCPIIACPQVEAPAACPATCAADADCATGEACQSGFCYAITPPAPTPCEAAGGACVALYPGNCADGTIGDATEYSCGGGLGVMCCLPR